VVHSFGVPPVSAGGARGAGARPALAEGIRVLEVFDREVTKWWAVERLARSRGIGPEGVVAIGDEMNDLPMIERAG
jgi:hydroxymethylpyrimidine pyrophosphatase-like HAD family hydrolase